MNYYFFIIMIYFSEKYLQFRKKQKHLLRKIFGLFHTSNRIYLLGNCLSNYIYLKDMYITLKRIGKIMFASVLRTLQISRFLNFTAVSLKKQLNFPKFACNFPCEKVNFSLINPRRTLISS